MTKVSQHGWIVAGALLIPLLYLPMLTARFDFIDDGNLVYPTRPLPFAERAQVVWQKIVANYEHLGPFRPALWVHWELAADLLQGSEFGWRLTRLLWCALATALLLWLFAELGIHPLAALFATVLAMGNPYRNEIWTSLTLSEGVAMPYALLALICARRAALSHRPLGWDLLSVFAVLMALGCKNTFAALVPAQLFLRIAPEGLSLREGLRRHGKRAALLSLTLLAPAAHYLWFVLHWHPGQYQPNSASLEQLQRILSGLAGALSLDFMGAGLGLAILLQLRTQRGWLSDLLARYRAALGAGLLLLLGGIVVYLPIGAMSGRYTMPAVWGLDLAFAVVLSGLPTVASLRGRRLAWTALACGLAGVFVANVGKQQKLAARSQLLWDAVEWIEVHAPPNARIVWHSNNKTPGGLNIEEGIHFQWHLTARGRGDVRIGLVDPQGKAEQRAELAMLADEPDFALWGVGSAAVGDSWDVQQRFVAVYWAGWRQYECSLGQRPGLGTRLVRAGE